MPPLERTNPFALGPLAPVTAPTDPADFSQYEAQFNEEKDRSEKLWGFVWDVYGRNLDLNPSGANVIYNEELLGLLSKGLKDVKIPSDSDVDAIVPVLTKEEKKKLKDQYKELRKTKKEAIDALRSRSPLKSNDINKEAQENTLEKIAERNREKLKSLRTTVGQGYKNLAAILSAVEKRKNEGKKISDAERIAFEEDISRNVFEYQTSMSELDKMKAVVAPDRKALLLGVGGAAVDPIQVKIVDTLDVLKNKIEGVGPADPNSILVKITAALDKVVDESKEKFPKFDTAMNDVQKNLSQLQNEIQKAFDKEKKVEDDDKSAFIMRLDQEKSLLTQNGIEFADMVGKLVTDYAARGEPVPPKVLEQINIMTARDRHLSGLVDILRDKLEERASAKDQREHAKGLNMRVTDIEKMMKTDYDALEIGKAYTDSQKDTYRIMIDSEEISIIDMEDDLTHLVPGVDDPTKTMVEGVVARAKERIEKLKLKIEKKRVAKEKEIQEKFDSIEKGVEEVEVRLREITRQDAEGKGKFEENNERAGILQKLWAPLKDYDGGTKYQDHASMVDTLFDPREDANKVKEWIKDLPEDDPKEIKFKKKMMRKARRLSRRVTAAKWRHYFSMDTKNKAKYWGHMAKNKTFDIMGNFFDSIAHP